MKENNIILSVIPLTATSIKAGVYNAENGLKIALKDLLQIGKTLQFDIENDCVVELNNLNRLSYDELVVKYIRERYSADDETAILRKKLAGIDEDEFDEYNAYAEECKKKAAEELASHEEIEEAEVETNE